MGCANTKPRYGVDRFGSRHVDAVGFHKKRESVSMEKEALDKSQSASCISATTPQEKSRELLRHLTKKSELIPSPRVFQMIDEHAKNTPREMSTSIDRLVTYLMSSCTTTLNTVRILYMWITLHVKYNNTRLSTQEMSSFDPEAVLTTRRSSLSEINLLFHHFCQRISIPCVLIHGVLRTTSKEPTSLLKHKARPNHVWSMVLVQEQWRLVDCACGTGFFDLEDKQARLREFFFLPDPEHFIITHFPLAMSQEGTDVKSSPANGCSSTSLEVKEGLQMLENPLKFGQFCQQAMTSIVALESGLELSSHAHAHVTVNKGERFAFKCPELSDFATVLREKSSSQECKHSTLCTRKGDSEYRAFVKPENRGNYKLSVYGKLKFSTDRSFHLLVDYFITADEVEDQFSPFPQHFGVWGPNSLAIDFGFSRRIYKFDVLACRSGELYVKLPIYKFTRTKSVLAPAVTDKGDDSNKTNGGMFNNLSTLTQYAEGVVHIKARFPEDGFYSLSLLAQNHEITDDATTTFINVANFVVNCMRSSPVASPYPKCFPITQNYQCLLLEPLFRDLHVGQTYTFRLRSPILSKVKIESQAMVKIQVSDDEEDGPGGSKSEKGRPTEEEWIAEFTAKCVGSSVCIYGCPESSASLCALYIFNVTCAESDVETMSTHM